MSLLSKSALLKKVIPIYSQHSFYDRIHNQEIVQRSLFLENSRRITFPFKISHLSPSNYIPDSLSFSELVSNLSISNNSSLLFYDNDQNSSYYSWFLFKSFGYTNSFIPDFNIDEFATDKDIKEYPKTESQKFEFNNDMFISYDELVSRVRDITDPDSFVILDNRPRFSFYQDGRIPGSISIPSEQLMDGSISLEFLENVIDNRVAVCVGFNVFTASILSFYLERIGVKSRMYLGGYQEWVKKRNSPIKF